MNEDKIKKNIAKNIRYYRKRANLTVAGLAKRLDTSKSNVSNWENNRHIPSISTLYRMCALFGVTINQMYGIEESVIKQDEAIPLIKEFLIKLNIDEAQIKKLTDEQIKAIQLIIKNFLDKKSND